MKNGDTNNVMKACCADLMDYVRKAAKFSRLPVPIQVTTLLIETENVNDLFAGRIGFLWKTVTAAAVYWKPREL